MIHSQGDSMMAFGGRGAATKEVMGMNPSATQPNYSVLNKQVQATYK